MHFLAFMTKGGCAMLFTGGRAASCRRPVAAKRSANAMLFEIPHDVITCYWFHRN